MISTWKGVMNATRRNCVDSLRHNLGAVPAFVCQYICWYVFFEYLTIHPQKTRIYTSIIMLHVNKFGLESSFLGLNTRPTRPPLVSSPYAKWQWRWTSELAMTAVWRDIFSQRMCWVHNRSSVERCSKKNQLYHQDPKHPETAPGPGSLEVI